MTSKSTGRALLLALAALCNTSVSAQTDFQCHADNVADSNQWYADATAANENGSAAEVINLSNQKSLVDTAVGGFLTDPALSPCDGKQSLHSTVLDRKRAISPRVGCFFSDGMHLTLFIQHNL
jgi:hypothetical protein